MSGQVDGSNTYKNACFASQIHFCTGSRMFGERNILLLLFCCVPYTVLFPQRIEGNLLHFITAGQNIPLRHQLTDQPRKDDKTIIKKLSYPWSRVTRFLSRRVLKRERGMILTNWTDRCYFKAWTFQRTMEINWAFFRKRNQQIARSLGGGAHIRSLDLNKVCQL